MKAPISNNRAMEHPAVIAAMGSMAKVASNISDQYEELRQAIDGGSESMTHEDAIKAVKYWQAEIDDLRAALQEREAVNADAERWRYMRQKGADWFGIEDAANKLDGGVDEAVDLAMKEKS